MNAAEIADLEARLANWRRCLRMGLELSHCASAEYRYQAPRDEDRRSPRLRVDELDAWVIEEAWRQLPLSSRWLLKLHYALQLREHSVRRWMQRRCGYAIKSWAYESERRKSLASLAQVLDATDTQEHHADKFSRAAAVQAWSHHPVEGGCAFLKASGIVTATGC